MFYRFNMRVQHDDSTRVFFPSCFPSNTSNIPFLMARCSLDSLLSDPGHYCNRKAVIQEHREHLFAKSDNININQTGGTEGDHELGGWASLSGQEERILEAGLLSLVASGRPRCVTLVCYGSSCSSTDKHRNNRTKSLVK